MGQDLTTDIVFTDQLRGGITAKKLNLSWRDAVIQPDFVADKPPVGDYNSGDYLLLLKADGTYAKIPPAAVGSGGAAGGGDMLKSVYDTNDNGVVDTADSLAWNKLTGVPTSFAPSPHEATHLDNGTDPIPIVTTTRTGLAPKLSGSASTYLNGAGAYTTPPTGGDMFKSTYDTNANGVVDTCDSLAWSKLSGVPASFTPSAHAASHLDNGTDPIPVATTSRTGLLPVLNGNAGTYLNGQGAFAAGPVGPQGPAGPTGPTGATGAQGPQGATGATGPTGPQGATGPQGPQGDPGHSSDDSPYNWDIRTTAGDPGNGNIRCNNATVSSATHVYASAFDKTNSGVFGLLQLVDGSDLYMYEAGVAGASVHFTVVGTPVNNGPNLWFDVTVALVVDNAYTPNNNQNVQLYLPVKGGQGPVGPAGPEGPQGPQGPTGATGPQGPQGNPGATGATGPAGAAATIAVGTTSTLSPGSNATVTNTGTSSAATFNFGIPAGVQGATGPTGSQGATGATGPQGPQGATGATGATGPQGPPGPSAVSADAGNQARLGSDNLIFVPDVTGVVDPGTWTNLSYSAGWTQNTSAQYRVETNGSFQKVICQGIINYASGAAALAFTFPAGARPGVQRGLVLAGYDSSGDTELYQATIAPSGAVSIVAMVRQAFVWPSATNGSVYLDSLTFAL